MVWSKEQGIFNIPEKTLPSMEASQQIPLPFRRSEGLWNSPGQVLWSHNLCLLYESNNESGSGMETPKQRGHVRTVSALDGHREETPSGMPEAGSTLQCSAQASHISAVDFSEMILWNENQARENLI